MHILLTDAHGTVGTALTEHLDADTDWHGDGSHPHAEGRPSSG